MAGTVGRVEDLVVKDGEVKGETETDGVSGSELSLGNVGGVLQNSLDIVSVLRRNGCTNLVGVVRGGGGRLALVARGELGEVTVVVTLPVVVISDLFPCR